MIERGLSSNDAAQFVAWVIESENLLLGYAVIYIVPFTFDLRPTVVLKELFIEEQARGKRFGSQLIATIAQFVRSSNARLLRWQVLPGNNPAKHFYGSIGGRCDLEWENWVLNLDAAQHDS